MPFEGLPQLFNPSDGLIVTANQKPVADDYPYQLGYEFADPYRAIRLNQLLSAGKQISLDDAKSIMGDTYHLPAEALRPHLVNIKPANDLEARAIDELRAWNLKCDPDQVGASIYQVWYRFLVEDTVKDELGPELTEEYMEFYWIHGPVMLRKLMNDGTSSLFDDVSTPQVETRDDILRRSLSNAVAWLSKHYGPNPKRMDVGTVAHDEFSSSSFRHGQHPVVSKLFSYGPIAAPGCDRFTVNAAWFTWDDPEHPYITRSLEPRSESSWMRAIGIVRWPLTAAVKANRCFTRIAQTDTNVAELAVSPALVHTEGNQDQGAELFETRTGNVHGKSKRCYDD